MESCFIVKSKVRAPVQGQWQVRRRKVSPQTRIVRVALLRGSFVRYGNLSLCLTETGRKCWKIISSQQRARNTLQMAVRIWPIMFNSRGVYYRPQLSCEGYVFTPVCQSFCSQGGLPQCMLGYHPPGTRHTPSPPSRRLLLRTVRILLECILISNWLFLSRSENNNSSKSWAEILSRRFSGAFLSLLCSSFTLISSCKLVSSFKPLSHFLTSRRSETLHSHGKCICNEWSGIPCMRVLRVIPYNE